MTSSTSISSNSYFSLSSCARTFISVSMRREVTLAWMATVLIGVCANSSIAPPLTISSLVMTGLMCSYICFGNTGLVCNCIALPTHICKFALLVNARPNLALWINVAAYSDSSRFRRRALFVQLHFAAAPPQPSSRINHAQHHSTISFPLFHPAHSTLPTYNPLTLPSPYPPNPITLPLPTPTPVKSIPIPPLNPTSLPYPVPAPYTSLSLPLNGFV
jgi:hypothetical protein